VPRRSEVKCYSLQGQALRYTCSPLPYPGWLFGLAVALYDGPYVLFMDDIGPGVLDPSGRVLVTWVLLILLVGWG